MSTREGVPPFQVRDEELEWARQQSPGDKLIAGPDLFDLACEFMKAGIRRQFPDLAEDGVAELLHSRLEDARRRSDRPYSEDE